MEPYVLAILSSAVIAAIVSGLFNVCWAHKLKRNSDIETFRYTKLYELNAELNSIPSPEYKLNDAQQVLNQSTERHERIKDTYNKAAPLLLSEHKGTVETALSESEQLFSDLILKLQKSQTNAGDMENVVHRRQDFEKALKQGISATLTAMLN